MIRGRLLGLPGRRRPFVLGRVAIPAQAAAADIDFLVDTGADATVLAPHDADRLGLDVDQLAPGSLSTGVDGRTPTANVPVSLTLGPHSYDLSLRVLVPSTPAQRAALARIPSLLGRDVLSRFALFFEERSGRVLLLEPGEADALQLP